MCKSVETQGVVIKDRHRSARQADPPLKTLSLSLQGPQECDGVSGFLSFILFFIFFQEHHKVES